MGGVGAETDDDPEEEKDDRVLIVDGRIIILRCVLTCDTMQIVFFGPLEDRLVLSLSVGLIGPRKFGGITNSALLTADRPSLLL